MNNLPDLDRYFTDDIVATFAKVHQPRSNFQLEKFVIGQHDTEEMRYYQCVTEVQALYYTIKAVSLELEKSRIEIDRLRATKDEVDEIAAQIKELGIEQTQVVAVGAFRELDCLLAIMHGYPTYNRNDIEQDQPQYWNLRLARQNSSANDQAIAQTKPRLKEIK